MQNTMKRSAVWRNELDRQIDTRNQLLRRGDWRFLLPTSRLEQIACFAGGLLAEVTAAVAAESRATVRQPATLQPGQCDLAVAANPTYRQLTAAEAVLRPGGALYAEYSRPRRGGIKALRRELAAAGFTKINFYFAWPWLRGATPVVWLPVDAPAAIDWYARRVEEQTRGRAAVRQRLQWRAWRSVLARGYVVPLAVVAIKPGAGGAGDERAAGQARSRGGGTAPYATLLLTGGFRAINKVVELVFAPGRTEPQWVIKLPRTPEAAPALAREAAILEALHAAGPLRGAPRLLHYTRDRDVPVLGESAVAGVPLWQRLEPGNLRALAQLGTDWLVDLAEHTLRPARPGEHERRIDQVVADFAAGYGAVVGAETLLRLRGALAGLGDLPAVCEHGDFSPWNVLIDGNGQELAVLDWEAATLDGLPGIDPIYFLTYLGFFAAGVSVHGTLDVAQLVRAYRGQRDPDTAAGGVIAQCLTDYARRLHLPERVIHPLRLLTWLSQAVAEYRLWASEWGGRPPRERLQHSLFVGLLQVELGEGEAG